MKRRYLVGILAAVMIAGETLSSFAAEGNIKITESIVEEILLEEEKVSTEEESEEETKETEDEEKTLEAESKKAEEIKKTSTKKKFIQKAATPSEALFVPEKAATPSEAFFAPENLKIELDEEGVFYCSWDKPEEEIKPKSILIEVFGNNGKEQYNGRIFFSITTESGLTESGNRINVDASIGNAYINAENDWLNVRVLYSLDKKFSYDDKDEIASIPEEKWAYSEKFIYEPIGEKVPEVNADEICFNSDGSVTYKKVEGENIYGYRYTLYKKGINEPDENRKSVVSGVRRQKESSEDEENMDWLKDKYEPGYEYQIEMQTLANLNIARNSDSVISDWWNPSDGKNEIIDGLLEKEGEELKNAVEEKKLTEKELGEMRVDIIASEEVENKYKELEEKYMTAAGVNAPKFDTGDSGIDGADIKVLGAGMNKIEKIKFSKDELPEGFSENAVSMDISAFIELDRKSELKYPVSITMPIPEGMSVVGLTIYHYLENGNTEIIHPRDNGDGTVTFSIIHFSRFVFSSEDGEGGEPEEPDNPSDEGDSRESSNGSGISFKCDGTWKSNGKGWWFEKTDGGYPVDTWYECIWNGEMNWYHFNKEGYLDSGWFTDKDGNNYYLHNLHDNRFGYMYKGWNWINGKCYYFTPYMEVGGLPVGALLRNATTKDGYTVNENGEWTVNGIVQTK